MTSEKLSKAVHIESEEDQSRLLSEYYYDPEHNATITLMTFENTETIAPPMIGKNETLSDFVKSIGEKNRYVIPEDDNNVLFSYEQDGEVITAKARTYRTEHYISVAITAIKSNESNRILFDDWLNSLEVYEPSLDLTADSSSHGVWEIWFGNTLTIQKIFGDHMMIRAVEPFKHGFAAERANLLAGQIKSIFTGEKIKYIGGDNVKNGADFSITDAAGNISYIQSKYYSSARGSVDACFDETTGMYKYMWDGQPMQIEV